METNKLKRILAGSLAMTALALPAQEVDVPDPGIADPPAPVVEVAIPMVPKPTLPDTLQSPPSGATPSIPAPPLPVSTVPVPQIPLSEPPQTLVGADGKVELDLVDPFQRQTARPVEGEVDSSGMSTTSLGEISEEFRILAIVIPKGMGSEPMALIRLRNESSPQVVKAGDLVQINRREPNQRSAAPAPAAVPGGPVQAGFAESAESALDSYSFYLHIKEIQPTHIEAYQKKSPNESIILRW